MSPKKGTVQGKRTSREATGCWRWAVERTKRERGVARVQAIGRVCARLHVTGCERGCPVFASENFASMWNNFLMFFQPVGAKQHAVTSLQNLHSSIVTSCRGKSFHEVSTSSFSAKTSVFVCCAGQLTVVVNAVCIKL